MNILETGGDNKVIDFTEIPDRDKIYARLIEKTYQGNRENFGPFKFQKSLNVEDITFTPALYGLSVGTLAEKFLPPFLRRKFQQSVNQDGSIRPTRESVGETFLPNLIRYFREQLDDGRYLFTDTNELLRLREQPRFIGERLTLGEDRVLPVREMVSGLRRTRSGERAIRTFQVDRSTDARSFSVLEEDILEGIDFMYKPDIPLGFLSIIPTAISMGLAIENLKSMEDKQFKGIAPRINHYKVEGDDLFTIRGTHSPDDYFQDILEGLEYTSGANLQIIQKKLDLYEDFIERNRGNSKVIIAGHSLGSLEMSHLVERLTKKGVDVESIGFAYPVLLPHSKVTRAYTFADDPLHNADGAKNHFVISKRKMSGSRFKNYHGIRNFYLND